MAAVAHRALHTSPQQAIQTVEPSLAPAIRDLNERLVRDLIRRLRISDGEYSLSHFRNGAHGESFGQEQQRQQQQQQ